MRLFYDSYTSEVSMGDVPFYVEEAKKAGGPVLEIGCGTGRITIPVAESGVEIVGLDRSPDMLDYYSERFIVDRFCFFPLLLRGIMMICPTEAFLPGKRGYAGRCVFTRRYKYSVTGGGKNGDGIPK